MVSLSRYDVGMISPATYNATVPCGSSWDRTFTWTIDSTAINWTGYTARLQVKEHLNSTAVLTLTNGSGITLGGSAGTIAVVITATQSGAITPGTYLYDLEVTTGTTVYRVLQGKLSLTGQVTV